VTVLRRPFARARRLAREALWECGIDEPAKIDPMVLIGRRKILVVYGKLDGATAQILRNGESAIIRVSDQIVQLGRFRFTMSHEGGHFVCGHRIPDEADLATSPPFSKHQEREADVFATEFLMPEQWVAPFCTGTTPTLTAVHAIAETFRTSLVASAVRYVELTPYPCAVVYSEHGRVVWAKRSATFPSRIPPQLKIGPGAVAFDHHESKQLDTTARVVPASAWFGSMHPLTTVGVSFVEHAELVPEPGWGGVLSLLWMPSGIATLAQVAA
jgi:Zn-dependent peptidase ImmA (M78 family)